jgi:hypothetical protein
LKKLMLYGYATAPQNEESPSDEETSEEIDTRPATKGKKRQHTSDAESLQGSSPGHGSKKLKGMA